MYSDLFDALGPNPPSSNGRSSNSDEEKPLMSFKAGKVELALQENNKFLATADTRRCQVNLKYNDESQLVWEWYDRREKKVTDTITITDPVTLRRVDVPKSKDADCNDRAYFFKLDSEWRMIWLQDKEEDPEFIANVNEILGKPTKSPDSDPAEGGDAAAAGPSPSSVSTGQQVDALSNILEHLGMPQGTDQNIGDAPVTATGSTAASSSGGGTKKLTLADLQSAMGGVSNLHSNTNPGLHEVVTANAISTLLENKEVRKRLLQELPEDQRSEEFLEANLRSPQVQQTLQSLTAALLPDDNGSMDSYQSVLANFQLDASEGQNALSQGKSPIQAFLDCVVASVEKEKVQNDKTEETEDDTEMKEE